MPGRSDRRSETGRIVPPAVVVSIALLTVAATAVWWSVRRPRAVAQRGADPFGVMSEEKRRDPVATVSALIGRDDPASLDQLVQIYAKWASFPETLEARKMVVQALLAHADPRVGLEALLTAVDGDQTRRGQDPMWPTLVSGVAKLLNGTTFSMARDRYYLEDRQKPKDLLLEGLAAVDPQKLSQAQRMQLAADLIDMYPSLQPPQKPAVDSMLTTLAGNDVVEILAGRGLGEDSHLQLVAEKNRAIAAARAIPLPPPVQEDDK